MTETNETMRSPVAEPRRLSRARDGRWLGGVCAGLGRYFGLNPMIYRIGFAALSLVGGTGILLYVAAWLVMPDDGAEDSIAAEAIKNHRERPWLLVGVGLLAFAALVGLSSARIWPSPGNLWVAAALAGAAIVWWQTGGRHDRARRAPAAGQLPPGEPADGCPAPASVVRPGCGGRADQRARPRRARRRGDRRERRLADRPRGRRRRPRRASSRRAPPPATASAPSSCSGSACSRVLAVALAVRVPIFAGVGDRVAHPVAFASVGTRYKHGIGNFEVDLHDVRFPVGETHVKATLGIGDLVVRVPERDRAGRRAGRGRRGEPVRHDGRRHARCTTTTTDSGTDAARVLVLDARVGLGQVEVQRG